MNRFYHEKSHSWLKQGLSVLLFLCIFLAFTYGLSGISKKTSAEEAKNLHNSIGLGSKGFYIKQLILLTEKLIIR